MRLWALAVALLAGAIGLSMRLDGFKKSEGPAGYTVPRADAVEAFATGYDDLLADGFWLQFLQYDGEKLTENLWTRRWHHVWDGLTLITGLDPHFSDAYIFGSWVLGDGDRPHEAERLVLEGLAKDRRWPDFAPNPRYDFQLGFIRFLDLHDYAAAGRAFEAAAHLASRPPFEDPNLALASRRMEAGMAERQHRGRLAIHVWRFLYHQAVQGKDTRMQAIAARALARLGAPIGRS